jgi:hypothetical protein
MRRWLISILTAGMLCSILLINFNNSETKQNPAYSVNRFMTTTSHGDGA